MSSPVHTLVSTAPSSPESSYTGLISRFPFSDSDSDDPGTPSSSSMPDVILPPSPPPSRVTPRTTTHLAYFSREITGASNASAVIKLHEAIRIAKLEKRRRDKREDEVSEWMARYEFARICWSCEKVNADRLYMPFPSPTPEALPAPPPTPEPQVTSCTTTHLPYFSRQIAGASIASTVIELREALDHTVKLVEAYKSRAKADRDLDDVRRRYDEIPMCGRCDAISWRTRVLAMNPNRVIRFFFQGNRSLSGGQRWGPIG